MSPSSSTLDGPYADLTRSGSDEQPKASAVPFWGDGSGAWDTVWVKGLRLPGVAEVDGKGFSRRVDRKKSAGRNGATLTQTGMEPADIDITLTLWTPEHLIELQHILKEIRPKKATTTTSTRSLTITEDKLSTGTPAGFGGVESRVGGDFAALQASLRSKKGQKRTETSEKKTGGLEAVAIYHPALALYGIGKVVIMSATFPEGREGRFKVKIKCVEWVSGAKAKGSVSTPSKAERSSLLDAGPGAVARRVDGKRTPAEDNTGP